ncbi:MAG: hypothetical protein KAJ23_11180 [Maribacter sp.]|nr:hypothetical protein [Maribacter sp.]
MNFVFLLSTYIRIWVSLLLKSVGILTSKPISVKIWAKRIQSLFWGLIRAFKPLTGYGIVVNTSFNVRGEPLVCSPEDA